MKSIVSIVLVTVFIFGADFSQVAADKVCAVTKRDIKSISESQNSADDIEDAFNTNDRQVRLHFQMLDCYLQNNQEFKTK